MSALYQPTIINYFISGQSLHIEEGSHCEFKGHRNFAIEEISPKAIEKKSRTAISRNICGFLNSGLNGTIYVGILDNGIVEGISLTEYQCDHVRLSIEDTLERFKPSVPKNQWEIHFVPVIIAGEEIPNSFRETCLQMKTKPHILRTYRKCWCDYEARSSYDHGIISQKFILIINVSSFNKERIIFQAEDGQIYFRKHTTLVKYSIPDIESQCREEVRLRLMPELAQTWKFYHIIKELQNIIEEVLIPPVRACLEYLLVESVPWRPKCVAHSSFLRTINTRRPEHKMKSEAKTLLTTPTEQPHHYTYLKEFRVQQCPLFLQHKCTQHRPYTCFDWHFMNQRRRRPVRKRDGTFNYSADNYCTKFDETTGVCPEGDDCPYLHRTAGDTERRYHLRYYKTGMCVHDTDSRGLCVKNGAHCAFSHGTQDLRPPVYDIKEIQALENQDLDSNALSNGPNVLDKERNLMNEDPKWQDTSYVLANYKTEPCKRPPRLCRQGYACPQYHNSRDKRRNPRKIKYRSTPCPSVKHGDEWGEPAQCENGDACQYCHTRTEQQFHPEIYKSTKCHDVQTARYCPRGVFCAFAHVEHEMAAARDMAACSDSGTNLAEILSTALGPSSSNDKHAVSGGGGLNSGNALGCLSSGNSNNNGGNNTGISSGNPTGIIGSGMGVGVAVGICANKDKSSESSNGSGEISESASTSSLGSNSSHSKAPGAQLSSSSKHNGPSLAPGFSLGRSTQEMLHENLLRKQLEIEKDPMLNSQEKAQRKQSLLQAYNLSPFFSSVVSAADTVESVVGNALDDLTLEDPLNLAASFDKDLVCGDERSSISAGLASSGIILGSSAPVNIPGSSHVASAATSSNAHLFSSPGSSPIFLVGDGGSRFSHHDCLTSSNFLNQSSSHPKLGGLFDSFTSASPSHANTSAFPMASGDVQMSRLAEAWRQEADESKRLASIAEKQRDEALAQATALQKEVDLLQGSPYLHALRRVSELSTLSYSTLESLRAQLLNDLREVDKAMFILQMRSECIVCKTNHQLSLSSCNHYVICNQCATTYRNECSYCTTSNSNQGAGVSGQNSGVVVVTSSTSNLIVGGSTTSATTATAK